MSKQRLGINPISKAKVIKSGSHGNAYYLGAIFKASGVGDVLGIWLIGGSKNSQSLLYSVNGAAYQFSGMRRASETKADARVTDPEARALKKHFRK